MRRLAILLALVTLPAAAQYVTADGERLVRGGQPLRLWGIHLAPAVSSPPYDFAGPLAARLAALGFNAVVLWGSDDALVDRQRPGELTVSRRGDGSALDRMDFFVAQLAERGILIVFGAPSRLAGVTVADYAGAPAARDAWLTAVGQSLATPAWASQMTSLQYIDDGILAARVRLIRQLLQRRNPFTGRAYAEDPAIAMLLLGDRQAFLQRMFENRWELDWHPWFIEEARQEYLAFLRARYPDEASWKRAWGEVGVGESLSAGTVNLRAGIEPGGRLSDLLAFARQRVDRAHAALIAAARGSAPAGVGANVIPIASETAASAAWYGLYGALGGDVAVTGGYWPLIPLGSALAEPVGFCGPTTGGSLELRPAGMPWLIYATGQAAPQTFRAEYPMRVAVHASLHNAAGVFWHEWATALDDRGYNAAPLFDWTDRGMFDLSVDSIVLSQMRVAGLLYRSGVITPFERPTVFRFGRGALEDPAFGLGWFRTDQWLTWAGTFHHHGATFRFDPEFEGVVASAGELTDRPVPAVYTPAPGVRIDRTRQQLTVDLPTAKVAVGRLGDGFEFADGVRLRELATPFLAFALVSADGRPVGQSRSAWLSAVAGVENTGFAYAADGTIAARGSRPLRYRRVEGFCDLPPRQDRLLVGLTILMMPTPKHEAIRSVNLAGRDLVLTSELVAALPDAEPTAPPSGTGSPLFLPQ